ncbi:UNVERIFIED_ORG: hypothetical protein GCAPEGMB_00490 [Vibrio phage V07]
MAIKLHAYKNGSESAKALRDALGIKMLLPAGKGKWKGKAGDKLINWGCSTPHPNKGLATYVNTPEAVRSAANKLITQQRFDATPAMANHTLPWTTERVTAHQWIENGDTVVCRQKLTGNSGEGIVIAEKVEDLVDAPLYTLYKKKKDEFRVHVFDGEIIDVQRKARKHEVEDDKVNWKVRNLDGGFIFARNNVIAPVVVRQAAVEAVKALGLVHGAVDIGHGRHGTYVYEVNTACGLAGSTLVTYAKAFAKYLGMDEDKLKLTKEQLDNYVPMNEGNKLIALAQPEIEPLPQEAQVGAGIDVGRPIAQVEQEIAAAIEAQEEEAEEEKPLHVQEFGKNKLQVTINLRQKDVRILFGNAELTITRDNFAKVVQALK